MAIPAVAISAVASTQERQDKRNPSVGAPGDVYQVVLPGSELAAKPLVEGAPIVIRITDVFPHGDSFRYDIRFHGLEPGKFDLTKWLERKDGTEMGELPPIEVDIQSLLPSGQVQPNALSTGWLPRLGGYRAVAIAIVSFWILGLLSLIFLGWKKPVEEAELARPKTLAELLETRLQAAAENKMSTNQYAELERMLFGFWRKRLNLESVSTAQALVEIKQHKEAGPLIVQLEQWMHNPSAPRNVDLAELVAPYRNMPANTPGFQA